MTTPEPSAPEQVSPATRLRAGMRLLLSPTALKSVAAIGDQAVVSGTNFLTTFIIGRSCVPEELGLYTNAFFLVLFVTEMQAALITTPYVVYHPRLEGGEHARYTGSTLIHQASLASVVVLLVAIAGLAISLTSDPYHFKTVAWPLACLIAFIMVRDYTRQLCFANLRMVTAFVSDACVAVLQIGGLLAFRQSGFLSGGHAYLAIGPACGVVGLLWLVLHRHLFEVRPALAWGDFKRNWAFGRWVFFSGVIWSISMNFYPWIITAFHGTASAGTWGACLVLVTPSMILLLGGQNFLGPKIAATYAHKGPRALVRIVVFSSAIMGVVMLAFSALMGFVANPLLHLLYADKYAGNGMVVFILSLNFLALAVTAPFSRGLFAIERADIDFIVNFVALAMLLCEGIWLTRSYGVSGAACGLVLANTAALFVRASAFFRFMRALEACPAPQAIPAAQGELP